MAEKSDPLDVAQVAQRDLSKTAFPGGKQDFRVFFDRQIHQRIATHAAERLSLEICGVLVGNWHRDADGPFVLINESIRCDKALSNAGDVTFTHEAWNEVHQQMDSKFTDRDIVGWYHSHPNFGIFLSDRDLFIHEHFFNGPGQIAYVVDPVNGLEGVFAWRNGKAKLYPHFWVGDEIHLSSQGAARKPSSTAAAGQPSPSAPARTDALPAVSSSIAWLLAAVCFLLLGYFLGGLLTRADRAITTREAVTHYGVFKGLKLGMRDDLNKVSNVIQNTAHRVVDLANEHISSLPGDAQEEKRKQWNEVLQNLKVTLLALEEINKVYSLTPDEAAEVERLIIAGKEAESENVQNPTAKDSAARDSGQKISTAKPSEKPAAEPSKPSAAPAAKRPDVKPLEGKAADTAKKAAPNQKP